MRRDDTQRARLDGLFEAHPRLGAAWDALGELHGLYLADDKPGALAALDRFTDLYQTGVLPEFHHIVNTLIAHMRQILAWHAAGRPSNGRIEDTNGRIEDTNSRIRHKGALLAGTCRSLSRMPRAIAALAQAVIYNLALSAKTESADTHTPTETPQTPQITGSEPDPHTDTTPATGRAPP